MKEVLWRIEGDRTDNVLAVWREPENEQGKEKCCERLNLVERTKSWGWKARV